MPSKAARAVTQAEVARAAGVSRGLVSLALAGSPRVAEHTRRHIESVAQQLGYRVNRTAATLASGRSGLIGLILPDLRNPFFDDAAVCLQQAAAQAGLTVLISLATLGGVDDAAGQGLGVPAAGGSGGGRAPAAAGQAVVEALLGMRVEGLVLVSPGMTDAQIRALAAQVPVCVIGRASAGGMVDTVRLDEAAAASVVVRHLREAGAASLVYLTPSVSVDPNAGERGRALAAAAASAGMGLRVVVSDEEGAGRVPALAREGLDGGEPVGVVAHNDVVALDALAALRRAQVHCPLVSYDDTYLARREEFSITSVEQPTALMAADAVRFVCERSGRAGGGTSLGTAPGRNVTVDPVLAVRDSSAPRAS